MMNVTFGDRLIPQDQVCRAFSARNFKRCDPGSFASGYSLGAALRPLDTVSTSTAAAEIRGELKILCQE
jgi:hypothetical protein